MAVTPTTFKPRRGTTVEISNAIIEDNELVVDTTKKTVVIGKGTIGTSISLAREDLSTTTKQTLLNKGLADVNLSNVQLTDISKKGIALSDGSNLDYDELYSNGVAKANATNIRAATQLLTGVARFATIQELTNNNDFSTMVSPGTLKAYLTTNTRTFSPMFIQGLHPIWLDGESIQTTKGSCRTQDDSVNIQLNAPITISLPSGTPNMTYHAFIGVNDVGNVIAQMFTTLVPQSFIDSGYTHYRRLWSVLTDENGKFRQFYTLQNTTYYIQPLPIEAPTSTYSEVSLPIPKDILVTPIIELIPVNSMYSIGITQLAQTSSLDYSSSGVCQSIVCRNSIMQSGEGTASVIGFVDTRTED